jgi:hypothetical protein
MAKRNLRLQVLHHGRNEDQFSAFGDPEDIQWLAGRLAGWLQRNRWHENRWPDFEIVARAAGESRILTRTGVAQ